MKNKATGTVVWTWHIWITNDVRDTTYYFQNGGNRQFLDRNIGATTAEIADPWINSFGFVYQWGRKDPFIGGDGHSNESASTASVLSITKNNMIVNTGSEWKVNPSAATASFATQNPMTFICNNTASDNLNVPLDWLSGNNDPSRWADANKTVNDPCPYGYKVPSQADLGALYLPDNASWYFKSASLWHWEYFHNNIKRGVWPAAGMRQGRSYDGGGAQLLCAGTATTRGQCIYWSSTAAREWDGAIIRGGSNRLYTSTTLLSKPYNLDGFGDNVDAYPVRCVKE